MKNWGLIPLLTLSLAPIAVADPLALTVHTDQTTKTVSTGIYGQFLEHIFNSVHGGLWGDQILNGTLELAPARPRRGRRGRDAAAAITPRNWEFVGNTRQVSVDRDNPLNAEVSVRIADDDGADATTEPGIRQRDIALRQGETYTLSLYARGNGSVLAAFHDDDTPLFTKTFTGLTDHWQRFSVEFTPSRTVDATTLMITTPPSGVINVAR
jgi:hypothetical protein